MNIRSDGPIVKLGGGLVTVSLENGVLVGQRCVIHKRLDSYRLTWPSELGLIGSVEVNRDSTVTIVGNVYRLFDHVEAAYNGGQP